MRLIVVTRDRLITFYWIKMQGKSITGWFAQDFIRKQLNIPNANHFDSHFTFPEDGNYHFSYKSIGGNREEYTNAYFDRVKVKIISNGSKQIMERSRTDFDNDNPFMSILVPIYRNQELSKVITFQFPVVSFNVFNGNVHKKQGERMIEQQDISQEDLVVDVSQLDNVNVNAYCMIRPTSSISTLIRDGASSFAKQIALPNDRYLELVCHIFKNDDQAIEQGK